MQNLRRIGVSVLAVLAGTACSASSGPAGEALGTETGGSGGIPGNGGGSGTGAGPNNGGTGAIIVQGGTSGSGGTAGDACVVNSVTGTLEKEPVDIIVILDNSGSMEDEMGAAEANINVNFADILTTNSVDYRVILLSRHRDGPRGSEEENTSICVAQPLSGLATCPAPDPVFSERFFQYSEKVESHDSFDNTLLWFNLVDDDDDSLAPNGWGEWLRPGAKKVFVEMTDDDEDMTAEAFTDALTALSPENFGTPADPNFTFHSIVGLVEKANPTEAYLPTEPVEMAKCASNGAEIVNPGVNYQNLSIATGGLRFPLCQFPGYDAVFSTIARDVVTRSSIACDFAIPPPPEGLELDLGKVAVNLKPGSGGDSVEFGQAATPDDCQENAFYIQNDRIYLCEEACTALQADPFATVDVLFKCESTIIPPR